MSRRERGGIGDNIIIVWSRGNRPPPVLVEKESGRIGFELGGIRGGRSAKNEMYPVWW